MSRPRSKSRRQYVVQNDAQIIAAKLKGAKPAKMPGFIAPCLATLRDKVPSGDRWIHEIKFDGYRLQLHRRENDVRFYTRRGHDEADIRQFRRAFTTALHPVISCHRSWPVA